MKEYVNVNNPGWYVGIDVAAGVVRFYRIGKTDQGQRAAWDGASWLVVEDGDQAPSGLVLTIDSDEELQSLARALDRAGYRARDYNMESAALQNLQNALGWITQLRIGDMSYRVGLIQDLGGAWAATVYDPRASVPIEVRSYIDDALECRVALRLQSGRLTGPSYQIDTLAQIGSALREIADPIAEPCLRSHILRKLTDMVHGRSGDESGREQVEGVDQEHGWDDAFANVYHQVSEAGRDLEGFDDAHEALSKSKHLASNPQAEVGWKLAIMQLGSKIHAWRTEWSEQQ